MVQSDFNYVVAKQIVALGISYPSSLRSVIYSKKNDTLNNLIMFVVVLKRRA